jgi:glycosyltransferase involved in cell wall biosynthesis
MRSQQRIVLVDLGLEYTGGQTYLTNLISLLSDKTEMWVIKVSPRLSPQKLRGAAKVVALDFSSTWGRASQLLMCAVLIVVFKLVYSIDAVWVNGYPEVILLPLARVIGCRAFATRHLTLVKGKRLWQRLQPGQRVHLIYERCAPLAHTIVCVSDVVALSFRLLCQPESIVVIPNWIPLLPELKQSVRRDSHNLRILFVGRLSHHKGASVLLHALRLLSSIPADYSVHLTIVGDGDERQRLETQAQGLNVCFVGFQLDPTSFYRDADLFINPTLGPEGMPLVSLDAMSHGLPCIFSDIPVHLELSRHGQSALLFENGNAESLLLCLQRFLRDEALRTRYGLAAYDLISQSYTADAARNSYLQALNLEPRSL